jgi:hypothetical protein
MLGGDGSGSDVVETPVVGFSDHRVQRAHALHAISFQHPLHHGVRSFPDAQGAGEENGCFELSQLPHLGHADELPESVAHVDGRGYAAHVRVTGVGQDGCDARAHVRRFHDGGVTHTHAGDVRDGVVLAWLELADHEADVPGPRA